MHPGDEIMKYQFSELIDLRSLSALFEDFYLTAGLRCEIFSLKGNPLTSSSHAWENVCLLFHRVNPQTSRRCLQSDTRICNSLLRDREYGIYRCMNGMIDAASRIIVRGEHVANIFSGQLFCEKPDLEWFRKQAHKFGFEESEYLAAIQRVQVVPRAKLEIALKYLSRLAGFIGELGLRHLMELEAQESSRASEAAMRTAQKRLQALSRSLLRKMEVERHHVAHELHDEVGQALTVVKMGLESIKKQAGTSPFAPKLDENIATVKSAIAQVRHISVNLRPAVLDDLGLVAALRWFAGYIKMKAGLEIRVDADEEIESHLSRGMMTACFRVAQEAVTNVLRHAKASVVTVGLARCGQEAELTVNDDGIGFNVEAVQAGAAHGKQFGLLAMQERVNLSGGVLEVASTLGEGTRITARFPLKKG